MNRFIICILITLLGCLSFAFSHEPETLLIINMANHSQLPKKFRSIKDAFNPQWRQTLNLTGLDLLNVSGSGQFSEESLKVILDQLGYPPSCYVLDLRQECHGFLNGIAVTWYTIRNWGNIHKSKEQIQNEEKSLIARAIIERDTTIFQITKKNEKDGQMPETLPVSLHVESALTEEELIKNYGLEYVRIPATDHVKPSNESVDAFIQFVKKLPSGSWLHIHCAGGSGRTTTFMSMYDMILNSKQVSFEDIMQRQAAISRTDLLAGHPEDNWKYPYSVEKALFLKEFYQYCQNNQDHFEQSWSDYLAQQGKIQK